jgi:hypothetical protein
MCSESIDAMSSVPTLADGLSGQKRARGVVQVQQAFSEGCAAEMEGRQPRVGNSQISMMFHAKHYPNAPFCKSPMHAQD